MYKNIFLITIFILLVSGCTSVPMANVEQSNMAKQFTPPPEGKSALYIYRDSSFGGALKKDVLIDDKCIGETAPNVFFYKEVEGNKEYKLSTESEFSPNDLVLKVKSGKLYFIRQYIKMGVFVGGAGLELIENTKGKEAVKGLEMAKQGTCSQ
jgi:PBP1b-binding outer membrane lipoprotein LpoB